jgi:hypothetical protein
VERSSITRPLGLAAALVLTAAGAPGHAQVKTDCQVTVPGRMATQIECRVSPSDAAQRVRFEAHFSGSHDDTRATMAAALDEKPVTCEDGSKTGTEGEDGDITLQCRMTVNATAGRPRMLRITLRWYHAEYQDFDFRVD